MAEYKTSYALKAPLSACRIACIQVIEELHWQLIQQDDSYILTRRPSNFWSGENSVTIQIAFKSLEQSSTEIAYTGSTFGLGPFITAAIEKAISNLQWRLEVIALSTTYGYLLVSRIKYLGGHPLLPNSNQVIIGLSHDDFDIHSVTDLSTCSIHLLGIVKISTGKPKTAREIYNEDGGYTLDVIEHSPFLSITFELDKYPYTASFQGFSEGKSQEWANQITAAQYQLRHKHAS